MHSTGRIAGFLLLAGIAALIIWAPARIATVLHNLLALSSIMLFLFAAAVLLWFLYAVILRRILRARRIANARMRRMMREAGDRGEDQGH